MTHLESLKLYEKLGLRITKIHRGIKFIESNWLEPYIMKNTNLRMQGKNNFEKDFFKLMNNSVFGKTMENIRIELTYIWSPMKNRRVNLHQNQIIIIERSFAII